MFRQFIAFDNPQQCKNGRIVGSRFLAGCVIWEICEADENELTPSSVWNLCKKHGVFSSKLLTVGSGNDDRHKCVDDCNVA